MPRRLRPVRLAGLCACVVLLATISGCAADGTSNGDVTFKEQQVPFTFRHPADFTSEKVDAVNSRGDVVALRALDKVDVLAVRRMGAAGRLETRLHVLGKDVTSRVVPLGRGWALECQYTDTRRTTVLRACDRALRTLRFR